MLEPLNTSAGAGSVSNNSDRVVRSNSHISSSPNSLKPIQRGHLQPTAFVDAVSQETNDYAALLRKLKAKERRPLPMPLGEAALFQGGSNGLVPATQRQLPPARRRSLPDVAAKYAYAGPLDPAASPYRPTVALSALSTPQPLGSDGAPSSSSGVGAALLGRLNAVTGGGYESEENMSEVQSVRGGAEHSEPSPSLEPQQRRKGRIRVVVRKRPVPLGEEDVVEVDAPVINVNAQKLRIDLSEYTEAYQYAFDDAFGADDNNGYVYARCGKPLIDTVFEGGSASCFAYGQTGSGKTYTMLGTDSDMGFYLLSAKDIFERCTPDHVVSVSLFEIYCNSLFDLLNSRSVVVPREDANKRVNICGLTWRTITSVAELAWWIDKGSEQRRTGSTSANEFSSRSHAVMTIMVRNDRDKSCGSLKLVDLAGSERAADTAAHDRQTRLEGAEINKSLLALKECIRGLDERKKHIPFRGSKLTEVLRDSFEGNSRTLMIAAVTPAATSVVHTLNTLRYAFRVKGLSIDQNVVPSKERKSKVGPPRSKSTEPNSIPYSILAQPLPPIFPSPQRARDASPSSGRGGNDGGDRDGGGGRKMRRHRRVRSRVAAEGRPEEAISQLQAKVGADIANLRQEMMGVLGGKDAEIERLNKKNDELEQKLDKLLQRIAFAEAAMEEGGRGDGSPVVHRFSSGDVLGARHASFRSAVVSERRKSSSSDEMPFDSHSQRYQSQ